MQVSHKHTTDSLWITFLQCITPNISPAFFPDLRVYTSWPLGTVKPWNFTLSSHFPRYSKIAIWTLQLGYFFSQVFLKHCKEFPSGSKISHWKVVFSKVLAVTSAFKVFDSQLMPILEYDSEVWWISKSAYNIEKCHLNP